MTKIVYDHSAATIDCLVDVAKLYNIKFTTNSQKRSAKAITSHSPASSDEIPLVVFYPNSTQQTSALLKDCHERRIAVTSFSGGTSFGGALAATRGGICISFEEMKSIVALHEDDMDVVVEPGLGWVELNERLKAKGLFFPVDPAPGATIGGMVSATTSEKQKTH